MKKSRRKFVLFFTITFCVLFMLSLIKVKYEETAKHDEFIVETAFDSFGNGYILSYDEKNVYLKKFNEDKKIEWCSKNPILQGSDVIGKSQLIVTPQGKAITYTYKYNSGTYKKKSEEINIYSEDGDKKKLILNDTTYAGEKQESILSMNYYDGKLLYSQDTQKEVNGKQVIEVKKIDLNDSNVMKEPEVIKTINYDANIGILKVIPMEDGKIIFTTFNSDIYVAEDKENKQIYSSKQTNTNGVMENHKITNVSYDDENNIYFLDTFNNKVLTWNTKEDKINEIYDNKILNNMGMDYGDVDQVKFINNKKFYAINSNGGIKNNEICMYDNGHIVNYDNIEYSLKFLVIESLKVEGKIILIGGIIFLIIYGIKKWTDSKITVSLKQIIIVVPVISISLFVMIDKYTYIFTDIVEDQFNEQIYEISRDKLQLIKGEDIKNINWNFPYKDENYIKLKKELDFSENNYEGYDYNTKIEKTDPHNSMYAVLYPVRDNVIYSGICHYNYVNIPINLIFNNNDFLKYKRCMDEKKFIYTNLKDFEGEWIAVISPILDKDGNVSGLIEIGITKQGFINNMINENVKKILNTNIIISVITIIVLVIGLYFSLRPLKKLKEGVLSIVNGKLGTQVEIKGNDEISDISKVFNDMSDKLKIQMDKLTSINGAYYRFVPQQMFELLDKKDVLQVNLGDQMKTEMVLACMTTNNFNELTDRLSTNDIFLFINKIFGTVAERIHECNGVIERYNNSGLISLYENGSADAIKCAVRIKDTIKKLDDKMLKKADIGFFIDKQEIMVGIIGGHNRISASAVSDYLSIIENLNDFGKKFGSSILVTEKSMKELKDCNIAYNFRKVGRINYKNKNEIITVYDFFDGDPNEIINLKKQTKENFERGVEYYLSKDFYNARRCFIEVLKEYQSDKGAKEYLILCDEYYKVKDKRNIKTYLKTF